MLVRHEDVEIILDFHVFDVQDFNLLIGHPIEKLLMDALTQRKLDVHLGKEISSAKIAIATNSMVEPSLDYEPFVEVKGILLVDSPESLLGKVAEKFIEKEDDPAEPIDISKFEIPHKPPIEFEPLPAGPEYVVLDHDRDSTMIIQNNSLEMDNSWAKELCEAPTLEYEGKDSIDEHGNFNLEIAQKPCSSNTLLESGTLSAPYIHEDNNQLKVLFCKIFRRMVVDVYVYRKHCRFRGCTWAITL